MAFKDWLNRTRAPAPAAAPVLASDELVPESGGGATPEERIDRRLRVYASFFGEPEAVSSEPDAEIPIAVHHLAPDTLRPFHTFVTSGMSDRPMNAPAQLGREVRRAELVFYAADDRPVYLDRLRQLALYPHEMNAWIHWGHTMPYGTPPVPLLGEGSLDHLLFMPTVVRPDADLGELLTFGGEPVNFLWVVPISAAECKVKVDQGVEALYALFEQRKHPIAFDAGRKSYV